MWGNRQNPYWNSTTFLSIVHLPLGEKDAPDSLLPPQSNTVVVFLYSP